MRKHLGNHSDVCHYWANKIQAEGQSGHMFFDGNSIYSYGRHYEIARWVKPNVIIFNSVGSSRTTESKHKPLVRRAIPHSTKVFYLPSFFLHKSNVEWMFKEIEKKT